MKKIAIFTLLIAAAVLLFTACSDVPPNSVNSVDDLWGKQIGAQLGTTGWLYAGDYEKPTDSDASIDPNKDYAEVQGFNTGADAVQALITGKVDCVIIDSEPAKAFVEANEGLRILEEEFAVEDYAIAVNKGNDELKDKINAALKTLKDNGTLKSIIDNYIGDETKGKTPYVSPEAIERNNGTLKMATNAHFPPYEYYSNNEIVGIDVDIAQAIADILGMELEIEDMEFTSIFSALSSGKSDIGVAGITVTPERQETLDFTDSYTTATQVIIVREK